MASALLNTPRWRLPGIKRMRTYPTVISWLFLGAFSSVIGVEEAAAATLRIRSIASGLEQPVAITHAGDGSGRLFITEQDGRVMVYDGTRVLPRPFLDIRDLVSCCGERGLLSVAFHPNYRSNGLFFVNYTDKHGDTVIARYKVLKKNPNVTFRNSPKLILVVGQPFANHNGGQLQFGPDRYLYIGMGDGGSGGDPENRAQNLGSLLGKMLRIDVSRGLPYTIPADNPFVGVSGARPEIWALGLRNPWRFSFDRLTGELFIGDVGQHRWEEVDFQRAKSAGGENYGWRRMEGRHCFNPSTGCNVGGLTLPIIEYSHAAGGCSITGGYRYRFRGERKPNLFGTYLYADYCTGQIWGARFSASSGWSSTVLLDSDALISTFGEGEKGEVYFADHVGQVYRIMGLAP